MKWGEWKWHKIGISRPPMSSLGSRPLLFFFPKFFLNLFIPLLRLCWNPYLLKQQYRVGVTNLYRTKRLSPPQLKKKLLHTIYRNCFKVSKHSQPALSCERVMQSSGTFIANTYSSWNIIVEEFTCTTTVYLCERIDLYCNCRF